MKLFSTSLCVSKRLLVLICIALVLGFFVLATYLIQTPKTLNSRAATTSQEGEPPPYCSMSDGKNKFEPEPTFAAFYYEEYCADNAGSPIDRGNNTFYAATAVCGSVKNCNKEACIMGINNTIRCLYTKTNVSVTVIPSKVVSIDKTIAPSTNSNYSCMYGGQIVTADSSPYTYSVTGNFKCIQKEGKNIGYRCKTDSTGNLSATGSVNDTNNCPLSAKNTCSEGSFPNFICAGGWKIGTKKVYQGKCMTCGCDLKRLISYPILYQISDNQCNFPSPIPSPTCSSIEEGVYVIRNNKYYHYLAEVKKQSDGTQYCGTQEVSKIEYDTWYNRIQIEAYKAKIAACKARGIVGWVGIGGYVTKVPTGAPTPIPMDPMHDTCVLLNPSDSAPCLEVPDAYCNCINLGYYLKNDQGQYVDKNKNVCPGQNEIDTYNSKSAENENNPSINIIDTGNNGSL